MKELLWAASGLKPNRAGAIIKTVSVICFGFVGIALGNIAKNRSMLFDTMSQAKKGGKLHIFFLKNCFAKMFIEEVNMQLRLFL
jgi:hypothetical protein